MTSLLAKKLEDFVLPIASFCLYAGLFLSPLALILIPVLRWKFSMKNIINFIFIVPIIVLLMLNLELFPRGNVFYNLGLGPKLLKGIHWDHRNVTPQLNSAIWNSFDYIAVLGAAAVAILLTQNWRGRFIWGFKKNLVDDQIVIKWCIAFFCFFYFAIHVSMPDIFDRYTLPLIPYLALLMLPQNMPLKKYKLLTLGATTLLIIMALFSIAATHDYLSWNRARKVAYNYLSEEHEIPITFIDAGFEINGWVQDKSDGFNNGWDKSWWFVTEDDFAITFEELDHFKKWKSFSFQTFLPFGKDSLFVLKKRYIAEPRYNNFPIRSDLERKNTDKKTFISNHTQVEFDGAKLQSKENARSGHYSVKLTSHEAFGLATRFWNFESGDTVFVNVWRYPKGSEAGIVIDSEYRDTFYHLSNDNIVIVDDNGWEQIQTEFIITPQQGKDGISIYIWNPSGEAV
ncbi:MAG: hypothetical protein AAFO07_33835, partial [Bacteroidota bacterium]